MISMGKFLGGRKSDRDAVEAACARPPKAAGPKAQRAPFMAGKTFWAWTVATFFGSGFGKPGPGTWGSAAATLLWTIPALILHLAAIPLSALTLALATLATAVGVPAATIAARESGRKDPGFVVIDEVASVNGSLCSHSPSAAPTQSWTVFTSSSAFCSFASSISSSPSPFAASKNCPKAGASSSTTSPPGLYAGLALWLISRWLH